MAEKTLSACGLAVAGCALLFQLPAWVGLLGLAAAAVGVFAVSTMMRIITKKSLIGFAAYVGVLGVLVLIDQHLTRIFF